MADVNIAQRLRCNLRNIQSDKLASELHTTTQTILAITEHLNIAVTNRYLNACCLLLICFAEILWIFEGEIGTRI